tara:strand:- start:1577 stop:2290 length:714 start_codon:yes stop_codon:yes gene_type:complete
MIKKINIISLIIVLIVLTSCIKEEQIGTVVQKKLTLTTKDETIIKADFYPEETNKGIVLLHMYKNKKESWKFFIEDLRKEGYNVLALDFRGHGESDLDVEEFKEEDFNKMILDVEAAFDYLGENNIIYISIIGASIGANVGLNFAAQDPRIRNLVLLSPGLDYRGIKTSESIKDYNRPLLIISGGLDTYSWESSNTLFDSSPSKIKLEPYETDLHGTELLKNTPEAKELIIKWIKIN